MHRLAERWIPRPRVLHPYPERRFAATHPRLEPPAGNPPVGICAGVPGNRYPYRDPAERREQATSVEIELGQLEKGGTRRFGRKAAAFAGWHEPDKSRGLRPVL